MLAAAAAGEIDQALALGREAVQAYSSSAVLRNNLACLLELGGDLAGAEGLLKAAVAEDPSLPQVFKNLGDLHYRDGLYDEALDAYERAAKLNPELGDDLYFKLGNIAYKRRDRERARTAGSGPPSSTPATSWPGPTSTPWGGRSEPGRRGQLRPPGPVCVVLGRDGARPLQGQVPAAPDRGADAGLRGAHLRRVPGQAPRCAGGIAATGRRPDHQRHQVLPQPRSLAGGDQARRSGALRPAAHRSGSGAPGAPRARSRTPSRWSSPRRSRRWDTWPGSTG